jgi:VanZ family protein
MSERTLERTLRLIARILVPPLAAAIVFFSIVPDPVHIDSILFLDKIKHVAAYGALGLVVALAIITPLRRWKAFFIATAVCAAFGAGLEILQGFVARSPDIVDWLCDLAGAAGGSGLAFILSLWWLKKPR